MPEQEDMYPIYPLVFVSGDAVRFELQIKDPDPDSPDPQDPVMIPRVLTGWTGRAQIRKNNRKDSDLFATIECTGFDTDGWIFFYLSPEESESVRRTCGWDFEITNPDGDPETILGGPVNPFGDYTQ